MVNSVTTWTMSSTRKTLACAAVALLLSGCGSEGFGGDLPSIFKVAQASLGTADSVSYGEAAAEPYASVGLRIGDSNQIMIILASNDNGVQMWTSAQHFVVVTHDGRILRTAGFGFDLGGSQLLHTKVAADGSYTSNWLYDFPKLGKFGVPIVCTGAPKGLETVTIVGRNLSARHIEEKCEAESRDLDWSFRNVFWKDPESGFVWKSRQSINPKLDVLEIETFRPPR